MTSLLQTCQPTLEFFVSEDRMVNEVSDSSQMISVGGFAGVDERQKKPRIG
jgi:hypothetical protein